MLENSVTEELGEEGGSINGENGYSDLLISGELTGGAAGVANGDDDASGHLESIYQRFAKDKPNGENGQEDGAKEEMFVDWAEEIEASGWQILVGNDVVEDIGVHEFSNGRPVQDLTSALMENMRYKLERAVAREANISREYKEEQTALKGELVHLHSRLKALSVQLLSLGKNDGLLDQHPPKVIEKDEISSESDFTLLEIINESSKLVEDALGAHSWSASINRDLQAEIQVKEVEIENLNQKIAELSVSHDVISSSLSSEKEKYSRLSLATIDKDRNIEDIVNRILDSLPVKVDKEGLSEESIQDKYTCLEGGISVFISKHNQLLSEIDRLAKCLTEIAPDSSSEDDSGLLSIACGKLRELKKKEFDLEERLRKFKEENTNLVKQLDEKNAFVEKANSDINRMPNFLQSQVPQAPIQQTPIQVQGLSVRDYFMPRARFIHNPIRLPPIDASDFEIKQHVWNLIKEHALFYGTETEDPYRFLMRFLDVCKTIKISGASDDAIRLRIFPFALRDSAVDWLDSRAHDSLHTWEDVTSAFLLYYFPLRKTMEIRAEIAKFSQRPGERLYEAWDRMKALLRKCPHHGYEIWPQMLIFYYGLRDDARNVLDSASGGSLMSLTAPIVYTTIERITDGNRQWDI